jgi:hypothetical protein
MDCARRVRRPALLLALAALGAATGSRAGDDPLAAEIARWSAYVRDNSSTDEMWAQVKSVSGPALAKSAEALRDGRRLLALQRLAAARVNPAAFRYVETLSPADRRELSKLEAEWARSGQVLRADLAKTSAAAFAGVKPAAVRAIAEAALPQVRVYYDASLEYGRNTMPDAGFYYLGAARAQRETAELCRRLSAPSSIRPPALRPLGADLDALEGELLAAYRPPASIEKHADFIAASSLLKEARELDAAGLRHGAVLRYLLAAQKTALLRASAPSLDASALAARFRELEARLSSGGLDHSIGRLFLESAQAEAASVAPAASPVAAAIVSDVLPRYFAAVQPPRTEPAARKPPRVTVTLVRWPYT